MNRLHKKCFLGSAMLHGLLLLGVVVGSAFIPAPARPKFEQEFLVLAEFPDIIVDENVMGGNGVPVRQNAANTQAPPEPRETPRPVVPEPVPTVAPPKPITPAIQEEPSPVEEEPQPQESVNRFPEPTRKEKRKVEVNLKNVVKKEAPKKPQDDKKAREAREAREERAREAAEAQERETREAALRARREAFSNIGKRVNGLVDSIGSGTDISVPGGSGPAYAGYSLVIKKIYDDAWRRPDIGDPSTVVVEVTIARDGRVLSSKIISKSSNSALDRSVKQALDRVRNVPPFPAGTKDTERTFRINYNLKSRTDLG